MSPSTIYISFDTIGESIGSSAYVILSDSETEVVFVPAILPKVALEAEVALVASPTDVLDLFGPFKAESEESSKDDASEAAQPLPAQIVARKTVHPYPTLSLATQASIAQWNVIPPPSSSRFSPSSEFSSSSSELSSSSSSSGTLHRPSGPLPRRKCWVSSYSTPSPSVRPSCSRIHQLYHFRMSQLRLRPRLTFHMFSMRLQLRETRLDDYSKMIREMYKHLLDMPLTRLETTEHELETLRARVVSSVREISSLHARARATELRDESSRVSLRIARAGLTELRR
ncbi:hypothetical protein Tco_1064639 [Tanacetum coccineum]